MCVCIYVYMCVCIYICIYVCVCVCIYIYIYIHIHIHIFGLFRATSTAYGGSQAGVKSELELRPTPELKATLDP